jgi:hypothetical protein
MKTLALTEISTGLMLDKEGRVRAPSAEATRNLLIYKVKLMKFLERK